MSALSGGPADGYIGSVERPIPHTGEPPATFEHKMFTCDECGAVVVELTQEKHAAWHQQTRDAINIGLQGAWRKVE